MIRSFYRLQKVDPGFDFDHLTSFTVALPGKKYATPDQREQFFNRLLENLRGLPGVETAAAASGLPLGNNGWQTSFVVDGRPRPPRDQTPLMEACLVTPDYFRAMNIPLKRVATSRTATIDPTWWARISANSMRLKETLPRSTQL